MKRDMRVGKQVLFEKQREVREDGQTENAAQSNILRKRRKTLESECAPNDLQRILASHETSCEGEGLDLCLWATDRVRTIPLVQAEQYCSVRLVDWRSNSRPGEVPCSK